jgi:hypothetical protein
MPIVKERLLSLQPDHCTDKFRLADHAKNVKLPRA